MAEIGESNLSANNTQETAYFGLSERTESVQKRIREAKLAIDESLLSKILFSKSKDELEAEWKQKRTQFPASENEILQSLLDCNNLTEEDLIILLAAGPENFVSSSEILKKASQLGTQCFGKRGKKSAQGKLVKFDQESVAEFLSLSRSEIYDELDSRIEGFARCGIDTIDAFADNYRLERVMPLERCLVLLAVPKELWVKLPKQQYVTEILKFGERSIMATINQGPLVYLRITRSSATLDLTELSGPNKHAQDILETLLSPSGSDIEVDPVLLSTVPMLERRIRNLVQKSTTFKRDTGKHGLFLGFPFIVMRTRGLDDNKTKLRVAPVLLFPARIDAPLGGKAKLTISSCDSDEVRLNPALPGILGLSPADEEKWNEALNQVTAKEDISAIEIIDTFAKFCEYNDEELVQVPGKEYVSELDKAVLSYSAALFHCDFSGKAVADDLRNITGLPMSGTALEVALRVAEREPEQDETCVLDTSGRFDLDDFGVITADPSQEAAVQQSRQAKGLHIEGPPGTGKSQTIVNIIADCVARNETVLVVCQKQAALSVVERRLKAEGLGRRLFYITDITKDRQSVVRALREQLDERNAGQGAPVFQLRKERANLVSRIQTLEAELNKYHTSLHHIDETVGLSYRSILSELIEIESAESFIIKIPSLRASLRDYDHARTLALVEECVSIAHLWLESKFEISPLQDLKVFAPDHADAQMITAEFTRFMKAEEQRFKTLAEYPRSADVDDVTVYVAWLKENEEYIREIPKDVRLNLSRWAGHFFPDAETKSSVGSEAISSLTKASEALSKLNKFDHSHQLFSILSAVPMGVLKKYIWITTSALSEGGLLNQINPLRALNRYRLGNILRSYKLRTNEKTMHEFLRAATLERELRPHRQLVEQINNTLGLETPDQALDLYHLQNAISILLNQLAPVAELSQKLRSCPLPYQAREFAKRSESTAFDEFSTVLKGVIKRHAVKTESLNCLSRLAQWFDDEWLQAQKKVISSGKGNIEASRHMHRFLSTIIPFQEFRLRSQSLSRDALDIFASLREHEAHLLSAQGFPKGDELKVALDASVWGTLANQTTASQLQFSPTASVDLLKRIRRIIRREACLAWKSTLETNEPVLTISKEEINYKVKSLAEAEEQLRNLNRRILAEPTPEATIAAPKKWEDITRLSGARAKRLRELVATGTKLGLMSLRPIWLMNPETASRLLPLTAGLFDAVIFDEASQLLVEYALPTLFRAKRAIVSGDEKQMPPPNFFAARVESDEALAEDEEIDETLPQSERDRMEESLNRREIKDCPDLLNLASAVLPSRSLQIHYRSEFRELIAFSNSAFYSGTLSIPSKHPAKVIKNVRPIEVINVNSVYDKQVNRGEALKVAEVLKNIWMMPASKRPTVGVVSFNLKQADLIEEVLEDLAARDESFKRAFEEESNRTEDGEDLGFFVKNLENVQGDERDIIIFSTTFGFDPTGNFRRNFGRLGQDGGERRLNVAITRAKRKIILVTSLPTEKISEYLRHNGNPAIPRDYVQAYMDYAQKISNGSLVEAERSLGRLAASDDIRARLEAKVEDPFIADVANYIRSLGYELVTREKEANDAFDIDIAVENPKTGLFGIGIECDAPQHRLLASAKHRELWRQTVLSRSIPQIHRISSREWYQKNDREKQLLREAIVKAFAGGA
ncbi:MAG: DUF4011 domain-containing protein [Candidatus Obscuribacterales bacterium]|jgi:hypothetical protein|nr:DUF4011 domain-containing protein [Candidatus Obscuribacterales bacterium]